MAQTKSKPEVKKGKKKTLAVLDAQQIPVALEPESMWKEEVEALLGQKFNSIVELIDVIAERVCTRLGESEDSNLHEFIVMMLDTDEEIRDELKNLFNL